MAKKAKKLKSAPKKPVKYHADVAALICSLLAQGQSLRKICGIENMPHLSTVMDWLAKGTGTNKTAPFDSFAEQYAIAREAQAEVYADEIIDIADDVTQDELFTDEGKRVANNEFIQRSRLRVDARKWVAAKLLPKKYGEKIHQEHTGADGKDLPAAQTNVVLAGALNEKSLDELTKLFTDKIKG